MSKLAYLLIRLFEKNQKLLDIIKKQDIMIEELRFALKKQKKPWWKFW